MPLNRQRSPRLRSRVPPAATDNIVEPHPFPLDVRIGTAWAVDFPLKDCEGVPYRLPVGRPAGSARLRPDEDVATDRRSPVTGIRRLRNRALDRNLRWVMEGASRLALPAQVTLDVVADPIMLLGAPPMDLRV